DHPLAQGRAAHGLAIQALRAGDPETAAGALEAVAAATDQARQAIARTLAARETCRQELPARTEEARRLDGQLEAARADLDALARDFAPASWRDVAGHRDRARSLIDKVHDRLNWVHGAASESVQRY